MVLAIDVKTRDLKNVVKASKTRQTTNMIHSQHISRVYNMKLILLALAICCFEVILVCFLRLRYLPSSNTATIRPVINTMASSNEPQEHKDASKIPADEKKDEL